MGEYGQEDLLLLWSVLVGLGAVLLAIAAGALLGTWAFFVVALVETAVGAHMVGRELRGRGGR